MAGPETDSKGSLDAKAGSTADGAADANDTPSSSPKETSQDPKPTAASSSEPKETTAAPKPTTHQETSSNSPAPPATSSKAPPPSSSPSSAAPASSSQSSVATHTSSQVQTSSSTPSSSLTSFTTTSLSSSSSSSSISASASSSSDNSTGGGNPALIGGIVGGVVGAVALIGIIFMLVKRQKRRSRRANNNMDDIFNSENKRGFEPMDDYHTSANNSARDVQQHAVTSPVSPFQQANAYPPAPMSPAYGAAQSVPMQPYAPQLNDMTFNDMTSPVMNYNEIGMTAAAVGAGAGAGAGVAGYAAADDQYNDPHKYQMTYDQHHDQHMYGADQQGNGQYYSSEPYYDNQVYYDQQGQPYQYDQQYDQHYNQQYDQQYDQQHHLQQQQQQPYYDENVAYQNPPSPAGQPMTTDPSIQHQRPNVHSPTPNDAQHAPVPSTTADQHH
ncbi:hypothetical protein BCR42DRAFT_411913 [Absidia repens]|uniref:Mid2 domain-containing protein n=1 Tax=Absidia repens TaxID=90262 RepID=A0A1X2IMC9_9FUNG|nr:hypothetical protein BCR42DRAFT_411913 [Absidia repens]